MRRRGSEAFAGGGCDADGEPIDGDDPARAVSVTPGALGLRFGLADVPRVSGSLPGNGAVGDDMITVLPDWERVLGGICSWSDASPCLPKSGFCPISSSDPPASLSASSRSSAACFITV